MAAADELFSENLLRAIAAELHLLNGMTAARDVREELFFSWYRGEGCC